MTTNIHEIIKFWNLSVVSGGFYLECWGYITHKQGCIYRLLWYSWFRRQVDSDMGAQRGLHCAACRVLSSFYTWWGELHQGIGSISWNFNLSNVFEILLLMLLHVDKCSIIVSDLFLHLWFLQIGCRHIWPPRSVFLYIVLSRSLMIASWGCSISLCAH